MRWSWGLLLVLVTGCGVLYISPTVHSGSQDGTKVRVITMTPETVLAANRSSYSPDRLPDVFYRSVGAGTDSLGRRQGATPTPALERQTRPGVLPARLPPPVPDTPYHIGIGDVLILATNEAPSTVEELSGLLAAQNRRQGYTVQDDGAIAVPDVGRIIVAGQTLEEAESGIFQRLVEKQIDPSFSVEIAEFNSKHIAIGGDVKEATVVPITLAPLYLDEALAAAGGVGSDDHDYAVIRLYRGGTLYQIPLTELFSANSGLRRIRLLDGDSIFVDTQYDLAQAQAYFEEQIRLSEFRQRSRKQALEELRAEVDLRRAALDEVRQNFRDRIELDAEDRDYVYLVGEVRSQRRFALPYGHTATLADALFDKGGRLSETGNPAQIYVLRGSPNPAEFGAVTAWRLNGANASSLLLATRMELRPNDVIMVSEQPVTRWNRVLAQLVPSLITSGAAIAATN